MHAARLLATISVVSGLASGVLFAVGVPGESCTAHDVGCPAGVDWLSVSFTATLIVSICGAAAAIWKWRASTRAEPWGSPGRTETHRRDRQT